MGGSWSRGLPALALAAASLTAAPPVAHAAVRPAAPVLRPAAVAAGAKTTARVSLRNTGRRSARPTLELFLSADARRETWKFLWERVHAGHRFGPYWHIDRWARVGQSGVWAHKVYKRDVPDGDDTTYSEDVRITLHHTPQP